MTLGNNNGTDGQTDRQTDGQTECDAICGPLLNVCGRYRVADIDLWPISTLLVADMVFCVADIAVANMVCGRYRCNSLLTGLSDVSYKMCYRAVLGIVHCWCHDRKDAVT